MSPIFVNEETKEARRQSLVSKLKTAMETLGRAPTWREFQTLEDIPSQGTIYNLFGTWDNLIKEAGGNTYKERLFLDPSPTDKTKCINGHNLTPEAIREAQAYTSRAEVVWHKLCRKCAKASKEAPRWGFNYTSTATSDIKAEGGGFLRWINQKYPPPTKTTFKLVRPNPWSKKIPAKSVIHIGLSSKASIYACATRIADILGMRPGQIMAEYEASKTNSPNEKAQENLTT